MVDIKEQDNLLRLQTFCLCCNLLGPWIRHLSYILIMCCNNHQRIQAPKPGPLTGRLMKCLDLLQELCPKSTEENITAKPLSGIEHLMESRDTPLLVLPQSKLVENTTKFIQSKIDSENFGKDWLCS